jgi:hypothetical protein
MVKLPCIRPGFDPQHHKKTNKQKKDQARGPRLLQMEIPLHESRKLKHATFEDKDNWTGSFICL